MKFIRQSIQLIACVLLVWATGCATTRTPVTPPPQPPTPGPSVSATNVSGDRLFVGNRVTIVFSGLTTPVEPHVEQIRNDGYITPPMLPNPVKAEGLTLAELQQELRKQYVPALFKSITITVKSEERYFFVGGEVRTPGQKPYLSDMTLTKAIQAAGDFTEYANKTDVWINRVDGRQERVDVKAILKNPSKDVPIYPGDIIHVNRTWI